MAQQPKAADATVRSAAPIVLQVPSGDTFEVIRRVLEAAGAPHGIEQAPPIADAAPGDFGRVPDRSVTLNGMRVGDALNTIVWEDPRYEWIEADGRLLVRAVVARGGGALDARVERFAVIDVSFTDALGTLVDALDPSRPRPYVLRFGLSLEVSGQEPAPRRVTHETSRYPRPAAPRRRDDERLITLALNGATLLEILNAIAQAHGELSWAVRYNAGGARLETATISLMGRALVATAPFADAEREAARMGVRDRIMIPVVGSLDRMLSLYTQRARVQAGIELLTDDGRASFLDVPPLDLTAFARAAALSRIVAFDSRFEWVDAAGIFNVRPKPEHAAGPSILEQSIETFSVTDITAEGALNAIGRYLGTVSPGGGSGEGGLLDVDEKEQRDRIREGRARPISLTLANSSVRDILNAVCRAHGTLSWSLRPHGESDGRRTYTIAFDSYDGWSVSKSFESTVRFT
jgi:hypothetical protein